MTGPDPNPALLLPPPGLPVDPKRRRLLALALAGLAAALLLGLVAPLAEGMAEGEARAERQRELLARFERVAAQAPALRRELDALEAELADPALLLRAPSASQAGALLQAALRRILDAEGVVPDSVQALPPAPHGAPPAATGAFAAPRPAAPRGAAPAEAAGLVQVALRLELRTDHATLSRILAALEAHRPFLLVREALVAAPRDGAAAAGPGGPPLAVRIDVMAPARIGGERNA